MKITIDNTPQDIYTLAGFTAGNSIQIQNQSKQYVRIYSGVSQPASKDDYFIMPPDLWIPISGSAVIFAWCPRPGEVMVQETV